MGNAASWKRLLGHAATRWVLYGVALALVLFAGRVVEVSRRSLPIAQQSPRPPVASPLARAESAEIPELDMGKLARPGHAEAAANLFGPSWTGIEADEARRNAPPPPLPLRQAPPLPFAFLGKLVDEEGVVAFLVKDDRNYVVRRGDVIDGTYRVEDISEISVTFAHLPLGSRQSLALGNPVHAVTSAPLLAAPAAVLPAHGGSPMDPAKLVWIAPPKVAIGQDFTIRVGLPPGGQPRSGRVELVYDPHVLAVLGGAAPGASSGSATAQRAVVEIIGPGFPGAPPTPSEVRFRVLAADPTNTRIGIENLSAVAAGKPLVVASPAAHQLAIVQGDVRSKRN